MIAISKRAAAVVLRGRSGCTESGGILSGACPLRRTAVWELCALRDFSIGSVLPGIAVRCMVRVFAGSVTLLVAISVGVDRLRLLYFGFAGRSFLCGLSLFFESFFRRCFHIFPVTCFPGCFCRWLLFVF